MILLAIDRGNTYTKLGVFSQSILLEAISATDNGLRNTLRNLLEKHDVQQAVFSSVRGDDFDINNFSSRKLQVFQPDTNSVFPFEIEYENKNTIGFDRLANAAGAVKRMGAKNTLVVDCGTCTTFTLVENKIFKGGVIAPGISMRLHALNFYTGKLPLLEKSDVLTDVPGNSTERSIRAGTELAAILETDALIARFGNKTADLNVLLTGGGMSFFEQHLKSPTFAAPYLTLEGLHEIFVLNK